MAFNLHYISRQGYKVSCLVEPKWIIHFFLWMCGKCVKVVTLLE